MNYFLILIFKNIIEFKFVHEVCIKVEQTKINLQTFSHPSSINHLKYAHVQLREPKKVSKRFQL